VPATNRASPAFSRPGFTACTKVGSSRSRGWLEQATPNAKYDVRPHEPRTNSEHRSAIRPLLFPVRHAHQRAPPGLRPRRDLRRARHLTPRARGGGQSVPFMGKRNSDHRSVELPVFVLSGHLRGAGMHARIRAGATSTDGIPSTPWATRVLRRTPPVRRGRAVSSRVRERRARLAANRRDRGTAVIELTS